MKKLKIFCTVLLFLMLSIQLSAVCILSNTRTASHKLKLEAITRFYMTAEIPVVVLYQNNPEKQIATFQSPTFLEQKDNECPQFSMDGRYLLILNVPWSLLYDANPDYYEWNLFDIATGKTITTFSREENPQFDVNNRIVYANTNRVIYTIEKEKPGFMSQFTNLLRGLFEQPAKKEEKKIISSIRQPEPLSTETKIEPTVVVQQEQILKSAEQPQSEFFIHPVADNKPISHPMVPAEQPKKRTTTEQSIVLFKQLEQEKKQKPTTDSLLKKTYHFLITVAHQPENQQNAWIEKYIQTIEKYTPQYRSDIKSLVLSSSVSAQSVSYEQAQELLQQIDELSSFMHNIENDETVVNSPEMMSDLGKKIGQFCAIILDLTSTEQKLLLHHVIKLIKKYEHLYTDLIAQIQPKKTSPLALQAHVLIKNIENNSLLLQKQKLSSLEGIKKIDILSKQLDNISIQLPPAIQSNIMTMQQNIATTYAPTYKQALQYNIETGWKEYSGNIIKIVGLVCVAGMTSALMSFIIQNMQLMANPNAHIDTTILITKASMSILSTVITQLQNRKYGSTTTALLAGAGSSAVVEMAITPYMQSSTDNFSIQMPTFIGPIQAALMSESLGIMYGVIDRQGGINALIKKTNFKNILLRPIQPIHTELTTFLLPKIHAIIKNEAISFALSDMGWKIFTAALIGTGMYVAGIGQIEGLTLFDALYYASLEGVKRGFVASLITTATRKRGALITVPSALALPAANMINSLLQGVEIVMDPIKAAPEILATTAQVATDFIVDEAGGFKTMLTSTVSHVKDVIKSRWSGFYDFYSVMTQGFPEVNPPQEESAL
jgi:hypothetical protein